MDKYISTDALIEELKRRDFLPVIVKQAIDAVPAADVAPVRRGEWIEDESGYQICSNCGDEHYWDEYRATYCESCGAKMDGGKR